MMSLKPKNIDYNEYWNRLSNVALNVLKCENVSKLLWNSSFSDVYEVCVAKKDGTEIYAESLYTDTFNLIKSHISGIQIELKECDITDFFPLYVKKWQTFYQGLEYLHSLYSYVNSQHVKNRRPTESDICYSQAVINVSENNMEIREMGLELWKETVQLIGDKLKICLLREIENDRLGDRTSQFEYIQEAINSLNVVGNTIVSNINKTCPYENLFEQDLLDATIQFYQKWASDKSINLSTSEYVIEALDLRNKEEQRCKQCYNDSLRKITEYFKEHVVVKQIEFLNSAVKDIVENECRQDLKNMFSLLSPYELCTEMRNRLYTHVVEAVRKALASIYSTSQNPHIVFVMELTKARTRFYQFNQDIFDEDTQFRNVIDKAFNKAINEKQPQSQSAQQTTSQLTKKNNSDCLSDNSLTDCSDNQYSYTSRIPKPADMLNRYVDNLLRKHSKTMSDHEFDIAINNFITLFKYIEDKDAFQKHYQRALCKRLIYIPKLIMDNEENVINQIKSVCGLEYTGPFQRMFNDIQLITQLNKAFSEYLDQNTDIIMPCNSQFMVLTNCSWPISTNPVEFNLNAELLNSFGIFYKFYVQKYQGRELKLTNHFSTVDLQLNYTSKTYFITVGSLQASILLYFDYIDSDSIMFNDVKEHLGISSDQELERTLNSLAENKLLNKNGNIFSLNSGFSCKRIKFRLLQTLKEKESCTVIDNESVDRQINDDRKCFIQAAIVRIMKSRKQLSHTMLMKEVLDQAKGRFLPAIPMIKKCIDMLIDKCYMERNPDNPDLYVYLA